MLTLKTDDITINILQNSSKSTTERDFELLVDYVGAIQEIFNNTKVHKVT